MENVDAVSSIFKNFKLISETIEDKTSEYIKGRGCCFDWAIYCLMIALFL